MRYSHDVRMYKLLYKLNVVTYQNGDLVTKHVTDCVLMPVTVRGHRYKSIIFCETDSG
jgi:hypothetical protein